MKRFYLINFKIRYSKINKKKIYWLKTSMKKITLNKNSKVFKILTSHFRNLKLT